MITLELPWPPSVNTYYRSIPAGRKVKVLISQRGREYRETVMGHILGSLKRYVRLSGRLVVEVDAFPPDRLKRDIDNLAKSLLDSIAYAQVFLNDEQIDRLTIERFEVVKGGKVIVRIMERP